MHLCISGEASQSCQATRDMVNTESTVTPATKQGDDVEIGDR